MLHKLRLKEFELEFREKLAATEPKTILVANEKEEGQVEVLKQARHYKELGRISPAAAIMEAWIVVESAAAQAFHRHASAGMRVLVSPHEILEFLRSKNVISEEEYRRAETLRELRNKAAHQVDLSGISSELIDSYVAMALRLATKLKSA